MNSKRSHERYWQALRDVEDPEFPVSVVDLGLIYQIQRCEHTVVVTMTFTSTACPAMDWIKHDLRERLLEFSEVDEVRFNIVWDPPWSPERLSEQAKSELPNWGVSV